MADTELCYTGLKNTSPEQLLIVICLRMAHIAWRMQSDTRCIAGFVHGRRGGAICAHGCQPDPTLGSNETPEQTLRREALEYQVGLCVSFYDSDDNSSFLGQA